MDRTPGRAFFPTALGLCGVAWGPNGLRGLLLPEDDGDAATRARWRRQHAALPEGEPPPTVREAIGRVTALLSGQPDDLADIVLDMDGVPAFHQQVYQLTRAIAPGQTRTYGELAAQLGAPGAARAVGQALGHNPFAPVVPCHRVLAAGGRPGGFSAGGGVATKLRMLRAERVASQSAQAELFGPDMPWKPEPGAVFGNVPNSVDGKKALSK